MWVAFVIPLVVKISGGALCIFSHDDPDEPTKLYHGRSESFIISSIWLGVHLFAS